MRKFAFIMAAVMLFMLLAVPALAAQPRMTTIVPEITVNGSTATCNVSCVGDYTTDELEATIELHCDNLLVARWNVTGEGYIFFSKTRAVPAGEVYTLIVYLTVNGDRCPMVYATDS